MQEGLSVEPLLVETQFFDAWSDSAGSESDLYRMAIKGGLLADRFAFVFSAGYQAAIRHIFPQLDLSGWVAFAVSEDRSEVDAKPGVSYRRGVQGYVLDGVKTWVAASDVCQKVVLSARGADGTRYFELERGCSGLSFATRPAGRMLPDLSQGSAHIEQVCVAQPIDAERVRSFGPAEVLYIYCAFLGSTWRHFPNRRLAVERILPLAQALCAVDAPAWSPDQLALDAQVQALLVDMRAQEGEHNELWRRDYKLIAMYSKQG